MEDKCKNGIDETIAYYDQNATAFVKSTANADVSELYKPFEKLLHPGAKILDLGCGSGRDSRYFKQCGYDVIAIDPSSKMCEQTKLYAGVPAFELRAEDMPFRSEFDAVWACASLLHVQRNKQQITLSNISLALRNKGIIYCSWKYGNQEREESGRLFTDMNEASLTKLIKEVPDLVLLKTWITNDVRADRSSQKWINALIQKMG